MGVGGESSFYFLELVSSRCACMGAPSCAMWCHHLAQPPFCFGRFGTAWLMFVQARVGQRKMQAITVHWTMVRSVAILAQCVLLDDHLSLIIGL